jgi:hypothetical protein
MAENKALDAFLASEGGGAPAEAAQPAPEPAAPTTPPAESKAPAATPAPAAKPSETKAPEQDEDHDLPVVGGDNRTVPFSALEKVRNDWKSKYAAEQARAELLAKQLEEAKRPRPEPAPVMQQQPVPDFHQDPQGFIQHMAVRQQQVILNERLNLSEHLLREKIGSEKVDEYIADFRQFAEKDRSMWDKLYAQPTPYQWLTREIDRLRLHNEIGDDVSAYRAKLIAEERAKWEAERSQSQPATSPAAGLPPSLANARSVAGRSAPAWNGDPSLEDVVRGIPSHIRAQRGRTAH